MPAKKVTKNVAHEKLRLQLREHEARLHRVEDWLRLPPFVEEKLTVKNTGDAQLGTVNNASAKIQASRSSASPTSVSASPSFSFVGFITVMGIIGLVIGLISMFTFAVANGWIGPAGQVLIGVLLGLILFGAGYRFHKTHSSWGIAAFGGAIFVEYVSIIGAMSYELFSPILALGGLALFALIGLLISLKYDSRLIAYFSIIAGLIPSMMFVMLPYLNLFFLIMLSVALLALSRYKNWPGIRLVAFIIVMIETPFYYTSFVTEINGQVRDNIGANVNGFIAQLSGWESVLFLIVFWALYNIVPVICSIENKGKMSVIDTITLNLNTFFSAIILTNIVDGWSGVSNRIFGLILIVASGVYLGEMIWAKARLAPRQVLYSLTTSGVILINVGLILVFSTGSFNYLIILLLPQWGLYTYFLSKESSLSTKSSENKDANDSSSLYNVYRWIVLVGIGFWWIIKLFDFPGVINDASIVLGAMIVFITGCIAFVKKNIEVPVNGVSALFAGFLFFPPLINYLWLFFELSNTVSMVLLSVCWLVFTLLLYVHANTLLSMKRSRTIVFVLLLFTLAKIAFVDLISLEGITRIIGFTVFGILLIIGGFYLKQE